MITPEHAALLTDQLKMISDRVCGDHGPAIEQLCQILTVVIDCLDHA